jgi:integrase
MATITKRKGQNGTVRYLAQARVRGYDPVGKSFDTRQEAKEWAEKLEREWRAQRGRGGLREDVGRLTIGKLVREHLADKDVAALRSIKDREARLAWWVNHYADVKIIDFGVMRLREARELLSKTRGPATTNRFLSEMRSCWNWAVAAGLIPQERGWPRRLMLKEPRGRVRYLSDAELGALLKAAEADTVVHTAIIVSIACGIRQGELLRLEWRDLDLTGEKSSTRKPTLAVRESKTGEQRLVYLPGNAVEALQRLKKLTVVSPVHVFLAPDGKPLRKSLLEHRWRPVRAAAGLRDFHWHDLRHTCASILLQQGATLAMVGAVLGHKSASMTHRYAHLVQGAPVTGHDALDSKLGSKKD